MPPSCARQHSQPPAQVAQRSRLSTPLVMPGQHQRLAPSIIAHSGAAAIISGGNSFDANEGQQRSEASKAWALTSPYDKEIIQLALPALVAMLLEPIMGAINTGVHRAERGCLAGQPLSYCAVSAIFLNETQTAHVGGQEN